MLADRTEDALRRALGCLGDRPGLAPARRALDGHMARLAAPMRVAVVGRVSSGKSTLTNALLGSELVATGIEELTYNVNWLRHAERPSLLVHFTDGRDPEPRTLAELAAVTARREEHRELLASIDYVEVFFDNPQLEVFDLIDTPGLDSWFGTDSQNTLRFLGRSGEQVRASTIEHAEKADALLLVFSRSISRGDEDTLADFSDSGLSSATPVNAIGVLTKVEHFWPSCPDPMAEARRVAERLGGEPVVRKLLFGVQPVCSLVGAAAETFTEDDWATLVELAAVPAELLERRVRRASYFSERDYDDLPVAPARRKAVFDRFGGWGIVLSSRLVRDGVGSPDELRARLVELSGLAELRRLVVAHFGNRAYLIKLRRVLERARELPRALDGGLGDREAGALAAALAELEHLEVNEHAFEELTVLQRHYEGRLTFTPGEVEELLRVTGERGVWVTDRLGLDRRATLDEMLAEARKRLGWWSLRATDPGLAGETSAAARTLRRSYERLVHHVSQARQHLELVQ